MHAMVRFLRIFADFIDLIYHKILQVTAPNLHLHLRVWLDIHISRIASQSKMNDKNASNLANLGHFKLQLGSLIVWLTKTKLQLKHLFCMLLFVCQLIKNLRWLQICKNKIIWIRAKNLNVFIKRKFLVCNLPPHSRPWHLCRFINCKVKTDADSLTHPFDHAKICRALKDK